MFADVVDRADVGMVLGRGGLRFALKAGQPLRVSSDFIWQELEGNEAMKPRVVSFLNHAHAAATQLFHNPIVRDRLTDHLSWTSPVWNEYVRSWPGASQRRVDLLSLWLGRGFVRDC